MKREEAVEARLGRILQRGDVPALREHVRELAARLANPEITSREIGPIVRKDVGLAARVIRAANSAQFNRSGRPISSLGHGVALIGLEALREMTVPLLKHGEPQAAGIRPVVAVSMLTAAQARSAALHLRLAHDDDAYLCGLFRGLGELLAAQFFPRDYAQILTQSKDGRVSETVASLRVMQCSFEDLGQAAARVWNLPPAVIATMHSEPLIGPTLRSDADRLQAAVSFAHEVTGAVHRVSGNAQRDRLARVFRIFGKPMGLRVEDIQRLTQEAAEQVSPSLKNIDLCPEALLLDAHLAVVTRDAELEQTSGGPSTSPPPPESGPDAQLGMIEAGIGTPGWRLERSIVDTLDLICKEGRFDRAFFLLLAADHQHLVARLSAQGGLPHADIRIQLLRSHGQAAAAILARRDLFVTGGSRPTRDWPGEPPASFGILPVVVDRIVAGALYFDRREDPTPLAPLAVERIGAARDLVGRMIASQRSLAHAG